MSKEEIEKIISDGDKSQFMSMLGGTQGFAKMLIYSSGLNEGKKNLEKILKESDLEDELAFIVFRKIIAEVYKKNFEVVFSLAGNPYVNLILNELHSWEEGFIKKAEKLYLIENGSLLKSGEYRKFLEKKILTDVFYQNFENAYLKRLLFTDELKDEFSLPLKSYINHEIKEKLGIGCKQFIFLSLLFKISNANQKDKVKFIKELKEIHSINKSFFEKDHKKILGDINKSLKKQD